MSVPIVFQINNKNIKELGCLMIEDDIPICIVINLDFIELISIEKDECRIHIIVETILHENYHELFHNENVPSCYHHHMIEKLNEEQIIMSILSYKPDCKARIEEQKRTIDADISIMYN